MLVYRKPIGHVIIENLLIGNPSDIHPNYQKNNLQTQKLSFHGIITSAAIQKTFENSGLIGVKKIHGNSKDCKLHRINPVHNICNI